MTATKQDFIVYTGNHSQPTFQLKDGDGAVINISEAREIAYTMRRDLQTAIVLTKLLSTNGITISDGDNGYFYVNFVPADTTGLSGFYYMSVDLTDIAGNISTISVGRIQIAPLPIATYSGDPAVSNRDYVRALVNDMDPDNALFPDPIYDKLLSDFGKPLYAAAQACRMLAARFSSKASKRLGDLSISYGEIAKNYTTMAADYQAQADMGGTIYVAGISKTDMAGYRPCNNPDVVGSFTTLDQFDNRGAIGGNMPDNIGNTDE